MYPAVEHEVLHPVPYVTWKHGVKRAALESCQAEVDDYLASHWEETRSGGGSVGGGGGSTGGGSVGGGGGNTSEVSALVARRFWEVVLMVPCTGVELSTACQAIIANETHLRTDRNQHSEECEHFLRDLGASVANNATTECQFRGLTENFATLRAVGAGGGMVSESRLTSRVGEL